jgi:hypothetical protein
MIERQVEVRRGDARTPPTVHADLIEVLGANGRIYELSLSSSQISVQMQQFLDNTLRCNFVAALFDCRTKLCNARFVDYRHALERLLECCKLAGLIRYANRIAGHGRPCRALLTIACSRHQFIRADVYRTVLKTTNFRAHVQSPQS